MEKLNREFLDCINEYNKKTQNFKAIFQTYYDLFLEASRKNISNSKDQIILKMNAERYKNLNVLKQLKNDLDQEKADLDNKIDDNKEILQFFQKLTQSHSKNLNSQQLDQFKSNYKQFFLIFLINFLHRSS